MRNELYLVNGDDDEDAAGREVLTLQQLDCRLMHRFELYSLSAAEQAKMARASQRDESHENGVQHNEIKEIHC